MASLLQIKNFQHKIVYGSAQWTAGTSWSVPSNVSYIRILSFGGGGGGASCWYISNGCGGGSAGQYSITYLPVSAGDLISITVGAAGGAATSCYATGSCGVIYKSGTDGGQTIIKKNGVTVATANGGTGGQANINATNLPATWVVKNSDLGLFGLTTTNGHSVMEYTNYSIYKGYTTNSYPTATYSGGQAGYNGNGGNAGFITNLSTGSGVTYNNVSYSNNITDLSPASFTGAGGGAMLGNTTGGANGANSGNGGSGGAIIFY